jgi:hypothetical protein
MTMLKVSHKAILKFATAVPNNVGTSAISNCFKPDRHCWKSASNDRLLLWLPHVYKNISFGA